MEDSRLFNLDCNILIDIMKQEGVKPNLIVCDPPYNISSEKDIKAVNRENNIGKIY